MPVEGQPEPPGASAATETRRATESLVESEARFRLLFERAPVGMAELDSANSRIVRANERLAAIVGGSVRSLEGRSLLDLVDTVEREALAAELAAVRAQPSLSRQRELRLAPASERSASVLFTLTGLDASGGVLLTVEVLARSRAAEADARAEELSLRERQWRLAFDRAPVGIAFSAPGESRWLEVNERLCEMLGYSHDELLAKGFLGVTHPDDHERDAEVVRAIVSGQLSESRWTKRYVRKDGAIIECEVHLVVLSDPHGAPIRSVSAVVDVTEKRRAQAAAQEAEARWAATIQTLPLGVSIVRLSDGQLIDVNLAFERITGYSRAELLGKTADQVGMAVDGSQRARLLEQIARNGHASISDLHFRTKLGEVRIAAITASRAAFAGVPCIVTTVKDVTEERRAEEALRAREEAVRTMFDKAPFGLAFISQEKGEIVGVNERLCQMLGYSREELLTRNVLAVSHPDDRAESIERMARFRSGDIQEVQFTKRYVRKDGSLIECDVHGVVLPPGPAIAAHTVVGLTDVTERRRAERAAQEAEQRWTATVQAAHVAVLITTLPDFAIVDVNAACERLTGYSRAEMQGRTAVELGLYVNPSDREKLLEIYQAGGHGLLSDRLLRRKDGQIRRCDVSTAPLSLNGRQGRVNIVSDVTERRQAEDALAASEARYRELVEQLEDPILSTDLDGVITFANAAVGRFGYAPADLIGKKANTLLTAEDRRKAPDWPKEIYADGETPAPRERTLFDKSGQPRPIRHTPRPLLRDGKVVGLISILIDLTAQREVEEQLRASQRMEAVGRLAGGVAHDFNNLLTVILAYANIARTEIPAGSPTQSSLEEVVAAGQRAAALTRQLLAFSRKQLMILETLSLHDAVGGVVSMLCRLIGEDIHLTVSIPIDLPLVKADRGQLEQVLMNLVINSRDAMPDGGTITIGARAVTLDGNVASTLQVPGGNYIELWVQDNGTGMDEATRVRVFEPFFTTKGVGKGTGLGLSTVYGIVKQFGGGITVDSQLGAGTTFRIYLPKCAEASSSSQIRSEPAAARRPRGNEQIMVVEDDTALRGVVQRLLKHAGYRVVVCAGPEEALEACRTLGSSIDLVLTDVVMPGMNGRELARRLEVLIPSARILYMSGYTDEALERLDILKGKFIRKPFTFDDIQRVVREALDA